MTGKMGIDLSFQNVPFLNVGETLFLKLFLRRLNETKRGVPVDKVCDKHTREYGVNHCIIPAMGEELSKRYDNEIAEPSCLYYQCLSPIGHDGTLSESISIRFPCPNSCQNSSQYKDLKEDARDSYMVIQLEKRTKDDVRTVLHEFKINTWIKAQVNAESLAKTTRRKPKGAAAQLAAKKRKLEAPPPVIKTEPVVGADKEAWFQYGKRLILEKRLTKEEILVKLWGDQ